jgi:hypothetical protein
LGAGFFQRVFTLKRRPDPHNGKAVLVGQPPHDFALKVLGEDDFAHTAESDGRVSRYLLREHLPGSDDAPLDASPEERARFGLRRITGEALPKPVAASMGEGAFPDAQRRYAASENVDPIDAATAVTSDYGIDKPAWECIVDSAGLSMALQDYQRIPSPSPKVYDGWVAGLNDQRLALTERLNHEKGDGDKCEVKQVYVCLDSSSGRPLTPCKLLILRTQTPNEARRHWQKVSVPRSFHSAVYGGRKNHSQVTAYDVAIGGGKAPTHPLFYLYLCAVADWRLKIPDRSDSPRLGIVTRPQFLQWFSDYWGDERPWRKALIQANAQYYSSGSLPRDLPLPPDGIPPSLVREPMSKADSAVERVAS